MNLYSKILINWYNENKRDLPWRNISDPYKIWISEIILQQTRVNQGLSYYLRFIERFPTVSVLAEANEDDVLKYWQGLGYYSRARNLHKAARQIMSDYNGIFPTTHADVLQLAGIGEYTAAAICSFAFKQPYAVVDGNVFRVLSRLFAIDMPIDSSSGKKEFSNIAIELLPVSDSDTHNQAIMEFGALQCVPVSPDCLKCPLIEYCKAYEKGLVSQLPVKQQKTKVTHRYFNYLFIEKNGKTFLQKRRAKDVWQNLYEFPLIESDNLLSVEELSKNETFKFIFENQTEVQIIKISPPVKHVLSHRIIFAQFIHVRISSQTKTIEQFIEVPLAQIDQYAVSRLMEQFLETI